MMKQLRESTKIIMILVSISFVGLMVFEWGMDYSGGGGAGLGAATTLGSVNGAEISIDEYQRQYRILYEQAQRRSPDGDLSADQLQQLEQQAWEDVVDLVLLRQEAERRDIEVTDAEILEVIRTTPPADIVDLPAFQTDGQFDPVKYERALADPALQPTWADYEAQLRRTLPIQKLQEQIVAGVTVTDQEILEAFRARRERARIQYLFLDPDRLVPADAVEVTDAEVQAHYEAHRDDYRREPSARARWAVVRPAVTGADSARVAALADSLARVARGPEADFAELAEDLSDDELTRRNGGDLGWFRPSTMAPSIAAAVAELEPGEVSPPVRSPYGWHVLKLENRMDEEGEERVRARHVLLALEPSAEARQAAREAAQGFARAASEASPDAFASVAAEHGLEVRTSPLFERGPVVPGIGPAPDVAEFVFTNDPGSISGAISHDDAYYVVQVVDRHPAGYVALEEVAAEIRGEILDRKRREAVAARAPEVAEVVRERGLEGAAERFGLEVRTTSWFTRTNNVPGIGSGTPVAGAAFGLAQGQVAGPIEADRGLYFLRLLERQSVDPSTLESERESLRGQLQTARMRSAFNAWFEALRERAEIEDNRAQLLGTT